MVPRSKVLAVSANIQAQHIIINQKYSMLGKFAPGFASAAPIPLGPSNEKRQYIGEYIVITMHYFV